MNYLYQSAYVLIKNINNNIGLKRLKYSFEL